MQARRFKILMPTNTICLSFKIPQSQVSNANLFVKHETEMLCSRFITEHHTLLNCLETCLHIEICISIELPNANHGYGTDNMKHDPQS